MIVRLKAVSVMPSLLNLIPIGLPAPVIKMNRISDNGVYCISHLFDGKTGEYLCDAIEDTVRDTNHNGILDNDEEKVYGETAIPCGRYYVTFRKTSLPIGKIVPGGCIPYVHRVPHFTAIRMHNGSTEKNSEGCIILGFNKVKGMVVDSERACQELFRRMRYRPFWLEIRDMF